MPSYPLTFPTLVPPTKVRIRRRTAAAVAESPFTYQQQVYQHAGARWEIDVQVDPMDRPAAAQWTQFFYDLQGRVGTFSFSLTPHCPGLSPDPGTKTFRLADNDVGWDSDLAVAFGFTFRAVEVL